MVVAVKEKEIQFKTTRIFEDNLEAWLGGKRRVLNEGGAWASKTYSILQLLISLAEHSLVPLVITVVSESLPHLKRGCIRDFFKILDESPDSNPNYNKTDCIYTFPGTKSVMEYFGADEGAKVRGLRRDILFINEGNNVPWEAAQGLDSRTRKFTIVDWNPVSEFWAHEYWMKDVKNNAYIHSTYLDAIDVLPRDVVENIESYRETDPNWWTVYGLGQMGEIGGLVYPRFETIDFLPPGDFVYGLDFGYSDTTALTRNIITNDSIFSEELIYKDHLTNQDISLRMAELGMVKGGAEIWADSAEPKSIEELKREGWNIKPVEKKQGSVEWGHQRVRQLKQHWTKGSTNCKKEQRNFRYVKDRITGKYTEKTTHIWSNGMDSRRYAVMQGKITGYGPKVLRF